VDRAGRTRVHYAALDDNVNLIKELHRDGVNIDASDNNGFTPLHMAAQTGASRAARALVELGANVNASNRFGNSPLAVAVVNYRGNGELIRTLLSAGADGTQKNAAGISPRDTARLIANYDVSKLFGDSDALEDELD
jgi:ankyrin repeat protein